MSHHFVFYHYDIKERLAKTLRMEEVIVPSESVLLGHGYLQHACVECRSKYSLPYHRNPIPGVVALKDTIGSANDKGLRIAGEANEEAGGEDSAVAAEQRYE